ncbi:MAG: dihydrofolate reductase family protein [Ignavibacteria bacterium]|nr:dihydrofolate reductase family protein [Ignavibacteria bacterium]
MRQLIYNAGVSADGFIAGPNGEFDWLFTDQDYGISGFMNEIDCTVMGRKTYDIILAHDENFFKENIHYVFTSSPGRSSADSVIFTDNDPAEVVSGLKKMEGKSIWLAGGGEIAGILLDAGLIDELLLSYHPVVLGNGIPLFRSGGTMQIFETTYIKHYPTGLVQVRMKKPVFN